MPPNLLAHYFYLWEPTVVQQAIETAWTSVSSGGHSSRYWCQQDSVFARIKSRGWALGSGHESRFSQKRNSARIQSV